MPFYDYRCQKCGHTKEEFVLTYSEAPEVMLCHRCQADTMLKCLSAPTVRFNGGGYYETDEKAKKDQRFVARSEDSTPAAAE